MTARKTLHEYFNGVTRFGMLTLLGDAEPRGINRMVKCRCDCGIEKSFAAGNVKYGKSTSCGCQFFRRPSPIEEVCHGVRHGWLTVVGETRRRGEKNKGASIRYAVCECDCGKSIEVPPYDLRSGNTKSCGCGANEFRRRVRKTHGMSNSSEYNIWIGMKSRATNPNDKAWPDYGGRGIGMCERWKKFENFYEDMGPRGDFSFSLERTDNNKGYSKENCKWATSQEQSYNRRNIERIIVAGEDMAVPDLGDRTGLSTAWIKKQMRKGMSGNEIIAMSREALVKLLNG